jgi:methionyl-tRNA formyltransferase
VQGLAEQRGIPCLTSSINESDNIERVRQLGPDFLLSFYYRNMIRQELLDIPVRGALNMHGSLLPKYRGRVPVNWAVINGEKESGASLHYMVAKPDAGDLVDQQKVSIDFTDTAVDLFNKVTDAAVTVLQRSWPRLVDGSAARIPLDLGQGSYFGGRRPEDGRIDWSRSAVEIYNLIRGVTRPYPGAFTELDGKKLIIWSALPVAGQAVPGQLISRDPFIFSTAEGLLEVRDWELV